jgi:Tol biopolymer transport system component
VDARTGDATLLVPVEPDGLILDFYGWVPDGKAIFYERPDKTVKLGRFVVRDLESGRETEPFGGPWSGLACPALSPDGRQLAFVARDEATRARVLKIASRTGGEPRVLLRDDSLRNNSELVWTPDGRGVLFVKSLPGNPAEQMRV